MAKITYVPNRVIDANGISDGASIYVYESGGSTLVDLFSNAGLTTPVTNPYVVPAGAAVPNLYTNHEGKLRVRIVESNGTVISDQDPYERLVTNIDLAANNGSNGIGFLQGGTGAVARTLQAKARESVSVIDFGADPTGVADSTAAFEAAVAAANGGKVFVPRGTYCIDQAAVFDYAGTIIEGESGYRSIIKPYGSAVGPLFYNSNNAVGTSSLVRVTNLYFDLAGQNVVAVDLSAVNRALVQGCFFQGGNGMNGTVTNASAVVTGLSSTTRIKAGAKVYGTNIPASTTVLSVDSATQVTLSANATGTGTVALTFTNGTGVRYNAPNLTGSYDNVTHACSFQYLNRGVHWDSGGNANEVHGSNFIGCDVGLDAQPASGSVDTPRVFGGRCEGCRVGLNDAATYGHYFGLRFEANFVSDINFGVGSDHPKIYGGYTATTATAITGLSNAASPEIMADELGYYRLETSASRPWLHAARQTFANTAATPATSGAATDYSVFFQNMPLLKNNVSFEFENYNAGTPNNTVQGFYVDTSNRLNIVGYDRGAGAYTRIYVGPNFNFNPNVGLEYGGVKVLGAQGAAVADATDAASAITQLNALLARCRAHGLIAT